VIEDVIPLFNVNLFARTPRAVRETLIVPEGVSLAVAYQAPYVSFQVPHISGHAMISLEFT
jgi:hypothetical protein